MNRYVVSNPSPVLAVVAIAIAATTIGLSVIAPAKMDAGSGTVANAAAPNFAAQSIEVGIIPARIDVVGVRAPLSSPVQDRDVRTRRKQPA